jgi:pimeloyl-ACP methyl ester carboxylesterase
MHKKIEFALAVLNGVVGDYLAKSQNGLATDMTCVHQGRPLPAAREALAAAYPDPSPHVVVLVHGLMSTEDIWSFPNGDDYGRLLQHDLGVTPIYVRYNSGLSISENGAHLAALLEQLLAAFPVRVERLTLLGYSMGGLVIRSACHVATEQGTGWLARVERCIYVGTPHLGAPLERLGRGAVRILSKIDDPYTRLVAEIADLRSEGLKDLGDARLTRKPSPTDGEGVCLDDPRHPVPLLPRISHYLIAGSMWVDPRLAVYFGDALVPLTSATNGACKDAASMALPPSHIRIVNGHGHTALPRSPQVYEHVREFCGGTSR